MNVDQHLKVAQWHVEQARLHAEGDHKCGCPLNDHDRKAIASIEAMLAGAGGVKEELSCKV